MLCSDELGVETAEAAARSQPMKNVFWRFGSVWVVQVLVREI